MIFVLYFFAALLVWFSFRSFRGGIAYLRFFREQIAKPASSFTPFVSVIVPCRGIDDGLEQNLNAIFDQNYPHYEVIFVVDDKDDGAVIIIDSVIAGNDNDRVRAKLIVANKAEHSSQKVENLREAVLHADDASRAFVFVDSDARPSRDWLRALVAPLQNDKIATGYRWFISDKPTFASELASAWNASIASALGPNESSNFCWGGSTAIGREIFEKLKIREKWSGTASDDFTVTRAAREGVVPIAFVPQALTASACSYNLSETIEFTNRQMKLTRVYAAPLWAMSLFGSALFNGVMLAAFLIVIFSKYNSLQVWLSIAVIATVTLFSVGKSYLRLKAVKLVLTQHSSELKKQSWTQNTLWLFTPALFFINCIAALFSRRMTWRGITYELKSRDETVIISPK